MSIVDLTIRKTDLDALWTLVRRENGIEAAAYVLCGEGIIHSDPWECRSRRRLSVHKVLPIPEKDAISAGSQHVTWSTASYVKLLKRAKDEGLVPGIVHTHPNGPASFSNQDDHNEKDLVQLARNRNGDEERLVSILLAGDDQIRARLWPDTRNPIDAVSARVVGKHFVDYPLISPDSAGTDFLARQALAFGASLNARLAMRFGVVGCGGTGSATAMLLPGSEPANLYCSITISSMSLI